MLGVARFGMAWGRGVASFVRYSLPSEKRGTDGMIEESPRRRLIGSVLLTAFLGLVAMAILGFGPGLVSTGLIFIALMVALNL